MRNYFSFFALNSFSLAEPGPIWQWPAIKKKFLHLLLCFRFVYVSLGNVVAWFGLVSRIDLYAKLSFFLSLDFRFLFFFFFDFSLKIFFLGFICCFLGSLLGHVSNFFFGAVYSFAFWFISFFFCQYCCCLLLCVLLLFHWRIELFICKLQSTRTSRILLTPLPHAITNLWYIIKLQRFNFCN